MTLPANDAFTLGLPHDPARIGLRSSSKIPFVSGSKPRSPSATSRRSIPPRQMTADLPDSPSLRDSRSPPPHPNSLSHPPPSNRPLNGAPLRHRKKLRTSAIQSSQFLANRIDQKSPRPPVDWEIPRKTLHSSIGMLSPSHNLCILTNVLPRFPDFVPLCLQWQSSHRRLCPQPGSRRRCSRRYPQTQLPTLRVVVRTSARLSDARIRESLSRCPFCFMFNTCSSYPYLQKAVNGVVWYIIGVIFVLSVYPLDIATVSILMYVISCASRLTC